MKRQPELVLRLLLLTLSATNSLVLAFFEEPRHVQCPPGYVHTQKPEGVRCMRDFSGLWEGQRARGPPPLPSPSQIASPRPSSHQALTEAEELGRRNRFGFGSRHHHQEIHFEQREDDSFFRPTPPFNNDQPSKPMTFSLPEEVQLTADDERCLELEKVFWPKDGQCYDLLQRGPCPGENEWLVLKEKTSSRDEIEVACAPRPCPCNPEEPQLCEVLFDEHDGCGNKCKVALAAEQDNICKKGEQLLINPFGKGKCGCRSGPRRFIRWPEDGHCYAIHTKGPCPANYTLQLIPQLDQVVCVTSLCPEGLVLHEDGRCYQVNSPGAPTPCDEFSEFTLTKDDFDPSCKPKDVVKRVFDMAPQNLRNAAARENIIGTLRYQASANDKASGLKREGSKRQESPPRLNSIFTQSFSNRRRRSERAKSYLRFLRSFRSQF